MPNIHELVNNEASQISNDSVGEIWFTNLDIKNAYSQFSLDYFTSSQCNFSLVGGDITGTYQFLTDFYGLGSMPKWISKSHGLNNRKYSFYYLFSRRYISRYQKKFYRRQEHCL